MQVLPTAPSPTVTHFINLDALISEILPKLNQFTKSTLKLTENWTKRATLLPFPPLQLKNWNPENARSPYCSAKVKPSMKKKVVKREGSSRRNPKPTRREATLEIWEERRRDRERARYFFFFFLPLGMQIFLLVEREREEGAHPRQSESGWSGRRRERKSEEN